MAMRYLIRRSKSEELSDLKRHIPDLDNQLGKPGEDFRRFIKVPYSPVRHALFTFFSRKKGNDWVWTCPSVELVAEDEAGLFAMTAQFNVPKPAHLEHLPG